MPFIFITRFHANTVDCSGGYEIHNLTVRFQKAQRSLMIPCSKLALKEPGTVHRQSTYRDLLPVCSEAECTDPCIPTHRGCFVTRVCPCRCRRCGLALKDTVTSDDNPCREAGRAGQDPRAGSFQCLLPWPQRGGRESVPKGGVEKSS